MMFFLWVTFHMSPLWGFKTFRHLVFYKHVAPLGLNTPVRSRFPDPLHLCGGFITFHASRFTPSDHYIKKPLINQPHRNSIIGELHVNIV